MSETEGPDEDAKDGAPAEEEEAEGTYPKLTDWFDRVYVINCAHRPDRLEEVTKELGDKKLADLEKVRFYPAIIGDWAPPPAGWTSGNGAWGCLQSHRRIMEDLMHDRDERHDIAWDSALILEDDVFFLEDALLHLSDFMRNIPDDWGQLYLGGQDRGKGTRTDSEFVLQASSINRTHAYAISRRYVHTIYQHVSYMPDYHSHKHIDHQFELAHQRGDWPVYRPVRWMCGQRAGSSNISGQIIENDLTWE